MKIWPPSVIIGVIHKSSVTMSTITLHITHGAYTRLEDSQHASKNSCIEKNNVKNVENVQLCQSDLEKCLCSGFDNCQKEFRSRFNACAKLTGPCPKAERKKQDRKTQIGWHMHYSDRVSGSNCSLTSWQQSQSSGGAVQKDWCTCYRHTPARTHVDNIMII